jgi:indole-3-glycerol phosphate synthase
MHLDPIYLAGVYRKNGAKAVSVLTDERYFKGSLEFLASIRTSEPGLPLLRKDFICDPYQVYEARAAGADAVLLIVAGVEFSLLAELFNLVCELGMTALIEIHNELELDQALRLNPVLVGINNRDLRDFSVDLGTSIRLRSLIPDTICVVAESGIHSRKDVELLARAGLDAILVGESLVTAEDIGKKVKDLSGIPFKTTPGDNLNHPSPLFNQSRSISYIEDQAS